MPKMRRHHDTKRPFRLYDPRVKKFFAFYYYTHRINAMNGAYKLAKWLDEGSIVEVLDVARGERLEAQYQRTIDSKTGKPCVVFSNENETEIKRWQRNVAGGLKHSAKTSNKQSHGGKLKVTVSRA